MERFPVPAPGTDIPDCFYPQITQISQIHNTPQVCC